jgi:hypothetical protein
MTGMPEVTDVRRIVTEHGSHIEPPLGEDWTEWDKLRWKLAVTLLDAGLPPDAAEVYPADYRVDGVIQRSMWDLRWLGSSLGAVDYAGMWNLMIGIKIGAELARAETSGGTTAGV